ncbi:MAG: histidine phosphatase family protein, partial [Hydrogenophilales bacterium 17-61-9]
GHTGDLTIKKGGVWWFQSRKQMGELQVVLRAVAAPDWL